MTDSRKAKATATHAKSENQISDVALDKVTGGRKAGEQPKEAIGSQSTGAGAGKVTFNPF
jgi:hypothetical protein